MAGYKETSEILEDHIPDNSYVVFDWDNTLKVIDRQQRSIKSRVNKEFLEGLKTKKKCSLFVISAISPSRINMETLLLEMDRLDLTSVFVNQEPSEEVSPSKGITVVPGQYACKGNAIICGYDKAEVFLQVMSERTKTPQWNSNGDKKVVFFDDEIVNIDNFSVIVKNSQCFHIVWFDTNNLRNESLSCFDGK